MRTLVLIAENNNYSKKYSSKSGVPSGDTQKTAKEDALRLQLFQEGLRSMGFREEAALFTMDQIAVSAYGKPFFRHIPQVHISLSHSGKYLACAFSEREIGLDIQECVDLHRDVLKISKRFFTPEEYSRLASFSVEEKNSQTELFFRLWSIKEAYLKYIGCGLQGKLNSFILDPLPEKAITSGTQGKIRVIAEKDMSAPAESSYCSGTQGKIRAIAEKDMLTPAESSYCSGTQGKIRVIAEKDMLTPAEYLLLPGPRGYTLALSAEKTSGDIMICYVDFHGKTSLG